MSTLSFYDGIYILVAILEFIQYQASDKWPLDYMSVLENNSLLLNVRRYFDD